MLRTLEYLGEAYREWWMEGKQNITDLSRLYSRSVVIYRGKKYKCKGTGCALWSESRQKIYLGVRTDPDNEVMYLPFEDADSSFPELGYYNLYGKAILISRDIKSKNWRYAFNDNNSKMSLPYLQNKSDLYGRTLSQHYRVNNTRLSPKTRRYIDCNDDFIPFQRACELVADGTKISAPVSRKVAIASSPYKNEIGIFLLGNKVGTFINNETLIGEEWARSTIQEVM